MCLVDVFGNDTSATVEVKSSIEPSFSTGDRTDDLLLTPSLGDRSLDLWEKNLVE